MYIIKLGSKCVQGNYEIGIDKGCCLVQNATKIFNIMDSISCVI